MSKRKELKKFCHLSKYINQNDKDLYEVFDDLCLTSLLRPLRDSSGITFLYPNEKAYRQKIINAAYSNDPTVAANMLKSLVLDGYYPSTTLFGTYVVNRLNQKVNISEVSEKHVKLENGLQLVLAETFKAFGPHQNMAVYILKGKGEISTSGPVALAKEKGITKKGGNGSHENSKKELQSLLAKIYVNEIGKIDNIYVKKVCFQLHYILKNKDQAPNGLNVLDYLGNDEFSDSYLLDMYCSKEFPHAFKQILTWLSPSSNEEVAKFNEATKNKYAEKKQEVINAFGGVRDVVKDPKRVSTVRSITDIRQQINEAYGTDDRGKFRMGKDLFIVFCNVFRDLWNTDIDKISIFNNFTYLASNVYDGCCTNILNNKFEIGNDLTLYGNLFKSDVFLYAPKASFGESPLTKMPSPLEMNVFDLSAFINKPAQQSISGGGNNYNLGMLDGF